MNTESENLNQSYRRWEQFDTENPTRTIIISGDIDCEVIGYLIDAIAFINNFDEEQEAENPAHERKPIKLIINSFGGSVYDGFGGVGFIENSVTPIYTYCYGSAMSMGLLLFVSGHYRYASKFCTFMYHECLDQPMANNLTALNENMDESKRIMAVYDDYLLSKTKLKRKQLDDTKKNKIDWYIEPKLALKYGITDEII